MQAAELCGALQLGVKIQKNDPAIKTFGKIKDMSKMVWFLTRGQRYFSVQWTPYVCRTQVGILVCSYSEQKSTLCQDYALHDLPLLQHR